MGALVQRTFAIWSFAFKFLLRYWLMGKKFTYGKQVRPSEECSPVQHALLTYHLCAPPDFAAFLRRQSEPCQGQPLAFGRWAGSRTHAGSHEP